MIERAAKNRPSASTSSPGRARRTRDAREWEGTATIAEEAAPASDGGGPRVGDATGHRTLAVVAMPALRWWPGCSAPAGRPGGVDAAIGRDLHPRHHLPAVAVADADALAASSRAESDAVGVVPSVVRPGEPVPDALGRPVGDRRPVGDADALDVGQRLAVPERHVDRRRQVRRAKGKKAVQKNAAAPSAVTASAAASVLTAGSATLTDFQYQGNVSVPVSGGTTEEMMEFTASSADLSGDVTVSVTQGGLTTDTSSPTLGFGDGMTLYATKLCGNLLGVIPVCFTPSTVSAVLLTIANVVTAAAPITMTDVTDGSAADDRGHAADRLAHHRVLVSGSTSSRLSQAARPAISALIASAISAVNGTSSWTALTVSTPALRSAAASSLPTSSVAVQDRQRVVPPAATGDRLVHLELVLELEQVGRANPVVHEAVERGQQRRPGLERLGQPGRAVEIGRVDLPLAADALDHRGLARRADDRGLEGLDRTGQPGRCRGRAAAGGPAPAAASAAGTTGWSG